MKFLLLSVAGLSTIQLVAAQPHARHQHRRVQRDTVTEEYVVEAPFKVVVYVDQHNNPISTTTVSYGPTTTSVSTSQSTQAVVASDNTQAEAQEHATAEYEAKKGDESGQDQTSKQDTNSAEQYTNSEQKQEQQASSDSKAEESAPATSYSSGGSGITYTPYNDDGTCKTATDVKTDFDKITGYSFVRLYGTNCNQLDTVLPAARGRGMKVFAGIDNRNLTSAMLTEEVEYLARACNGDWDIYSTISVGNEVVQAGGDANTVVSAIKQVRTALRGKGYQGPVVTVDTVGAMKSSPSLCEASDYAACNVHAFFNGQVVAADAGKFVAGEVKLAESFCSGKKVVVTETGWPSQGGTNGAAVPSPENQQAAIKSIADAFSGNPGDVTYFSAFDEKWKVDRGDTFGCEKFYGILH